MQVETEKVAGASLQCVSCSVIRAPSSVLYWYFFHLFLRYRTKHHTYTHGVSIKKIILKKKKEKKLHIIKFAINTGIKCFVVKKLNELHPLKFIFLYTIHAGGNYNYMLQYTNAYCLSILIHNTGGYTDRRTDAICNYYKLSN